MNIYEKLLNIQNELKVPKKQFNKFGNFNFRNCEDIMEAVKPICKKYNAVLVVSDKIIAIGERYYVEASAVLYDIENEDKIQGQMFICNTAYAREENEKKGMDGSQLTGAASSYARKYALNGLFNIDDTKDNDSISQEEHEYQEQTIIPKLATGLQLAIEQNGFNESFVSAVLGGFGYTTVEEIKNKDYLKIVEQFKKEKK